jgi:urease accessory protein
VTLALAGGLLELRFEAGVGERTVLSERSQRFPLRTTVPLYLDPGAPDLAFVYVQNPTGGTFAGDSLVTRIRAGASARVHVTTPAATKVYRGDGGAARQLVEIEIGVGGYVEYVPELLIPHTGSRLDQRLEIVLGSGAAFVGIDALAPGRLASGETFAYERVRLATVVRDGAGLELCADTMELEPARRSPTCRGLLGAFSYAGSVVVAAERANAEFAASLDAVLGAVPHVLGAAGPLPNGAGAYARVLTNSSKALRTALDTAWRVARVALIGVAPPPRRK